VHLLPRCPIARTYLRSTLPNASCESEGRIAVRVAYLGPSPLLGSVRLLLMGNDCLDLLIVSFARGEALPSQCPNILCHGPG
jgi:hypothetical protein